MTKIYGEIKHPRLYLLKMEIFKSLAIPYFISRNLSNDDVNSLFNGIADVSKYQCSLCLSIKYF